MFRFIHDCQTATLHLEQARGRGLALGPRLRLWLHLLNCPHCRRYAQQSRALEVMAGRLAESAAGRLPAEARHRLLRVLREAGYE